MPMSVEISAIIVARKGSVRIKSKSLLELNGETLIERKIRQLKQCKNINRIILGSDSDEMLEVAYKAGAEAIRRPDYFCDETKASANDMIRNMMDLIKTDIVADIRIQQLYERVSDSIWFPKQLNTNIIFLKEPVQNYDSVTKETITDTILMTGIGKSYLKDIKVNNEISDKIFDFNNI